MLEFNLVHNADAVSLLIKNCIADGRDIPEKFKNAPELRSHLALYYDAFTELGSCRSYGMGVGMIPWTAAKDYAVFHCFDEDQFRLLTWYLREMDEVFLQHINKKTSTPANAGKK